MQTHKQNVVLVSEIQNRELPVLASIFNKEEAQSKLSSKLKKFQQLSLVPKAV